MRPVASYCRWKNALIACWEVPCGLLCLALGLGLVPYFVAVEVVGRQGGSWALLLLAAVPLLFAWVLLPDGVSSARAALDKDGWLKAGPEGVSFRLPPGGERVIAWREITDWYPRVTKVNGVPMASRLVLETRTETIQLSGAYFREPIAKIIDNIVDARGPRAG